MSRHKRISVSGQSKVAQARNSAIESLKLKGFDSLDYKCIYGMIISAMNEGQVETVRRSYKF